MTATVNKISEIKSVGTYMFCGNIITVNDFTSSGKLRGVCTLEDGTEFNFTNGASNLAKRIANGGKTPKRDSTTTGAGSFEKTFIKLQKAMQEAENAFATFQYDNSIFSLEDAQEADQKAAAKKQATSKRTKKQAVRRTEDALLSRIKVLRRWAKSTNRLMLFQQLTDKMLEITE